MPNNGKLLIKTGSKAQCMAQTTEVAIPIASQLIFVVIFFRPQRYVFCNDVASCNIYRVHLKLSLLISVGEDTDRGSAVVGVLTEHLLLRQFSAVVGVLTDHLLKICILQ